MIKFVYMENIFNFLNELNIRLQGSCTNIFTFRNKVNKGAGPLR